MPIPQRLPAVDGDDGEWGDILNQFLEKEHYNTGADNAANGGHKTITVRAGTATAGTAPIKLTSGTVLGTPEAGAIEFNSNRLYFTQTTGPTRKVLAAFDDSSGAEGDLYYRDSSGHFVRLGIGSQGQSLLSLGGTPNWGTPKLAIATKTSNYPAVVGDLVILANATSGNVTITIPDATLVSSSQYIVKRIDGSANTLTVDTGGGTIDGSSSITIPRQYVSVHLVSDGTNWFVI